MNEEELWQATGRLFSPVAIATGAKRAGEHELYADEAALVAHAVVARRADFAAGRAAARDALDRLGCPPCAIPSGPRHAPVWPSGVIGSISHSGGWAVAAVARAGELRALGIDIEVARELPREVEALVVSRDDRLAALPLASTLAFSAKESVYKALFPAHGLVLEFEEVALDLRKDGTFTARAGSHDLRGRWSRVAELLVTAAWQ